MKKTVLFLICLITGTFGFSQKDVASNYKRLKTKKFHERHSDPSALSTLLFNMRKSNYKTIANCTPCILKYYDENNKLIHKAIQYTDCWVGAFEEYYPNGKVKLSGQYLENTTGNWENIYERGYCNVPDGIWTYFNEKGDKTYCEYWEKGEFTKQLPEQDLAEIWTFELLLNEEKFEKKQIPIHEIKNLVVIPRFKNENRSNINLTLKVEVYSEGYPSNSQSLTLDSFKNIDVPKMLEDAGIPSDETTIFILKILNNQKIIDRFILDIGK